MHPLRTLFTSLALLPFLAQADTFVLTNGDKIDGSIIRETDKSYIVEVNIAKTIKEEREIPKDKVLRILKPDPGIAAYEQLRNLVPTPDGLNAGDYRQRIELMTEFIEKYPANEHIRKAISIRDELRNEMRQVEEGSRKIDGVLYPAAELRENAYELDARVEARKIKDLAKQGKHLESLRAYQSFQKEYAYTKVNMDLVPIVKQLIAVHVGQVTEWRGTLEDRLVEREKGLARMTPGDRRASMRAIEEEKAQLNQLYRTETATMVGWVTPHPFGRLSLDYTIQYAKTELRRLENFLNRHFTDGGQIYRDLYKMKSQEAEDRLIREKIRTAQKLGIPNRYLDKFTLAAGSL